MKKRGLNRNFIEIIELSKQSFLRKILPLSKEDSRQKLSVILRIFVKYPFSVELLGSTVLQSFLLPWKFCGKFGNISDNGYRVIPESFEDGTFLKDFEGFALLPSQQPGGTLIGNVVLRDRETDGLPDHDPKLAEISRKSEIVAC